jgi:hypothetical protein
MRPSGKPKTQDVESLFFHQRADTKFTCPDADAQRMKDVNVSVMEAKVNEIDEDVLLDLSHLAPTFRKHDSKTHASVHRSCHCFAITLFLSFVPKLNLPVSHLLHRASGKRPRGSPDARGQEHRRRLLFGSCCWCKATFLRSSAEREMSELPAFQILRKVSRS